MRRADGPSMDPGRRKAWLEGEHLDAMALRVEVIGLRQQLKGAVEALRWIAEYDERDGRRIDDPSEAKSCIARNWLDAHSTTGGQ